eukprot:402415_1
MAWIAAGAVGLGAIGVGLYATAPPSLQQYPINNQDKETPAYPQGRSSLYIHPEAEMEPQLTKGGMGSVPPSTVTQEFQNCVKRHPNALAVVAPADESREARQWTWSQYCADVKKAAKAFIHLGMKPHQAVAIIGFNSPEWFFSNMGAIFAGGKAAGIYTTNGAEGCKYIT